MSSFPSFPGNNLPTLTYRPRVEHRKPLPDDESEGVFKKLTGYGTSALQTGLHILDTPGAIVRGGIGHLIGARPAEGERTSGRDLTDAIGLTRKGARGWGHSAAGLGTELLTDPLTYFTGGAHHALTPAGKALGKVGATRGFSRRNMLAGFNDLESTLTAAGKTAEDIAHIRDKGYRIATPAHEAAVLAATGSPLRAGQPLGALGGFGLPFGPPKILLGTGRGAQKVAGGLDAIGGKLKYGTAPGRWFNGHFDPNVREAVGGATQKAMARYGTPAMEAHSIAGRDELYRGVSGIHQAIQSGLPEGDILRAARQHLEGVPIQSGRPHHAIPTVANPALQSAASSVGDVVRKAEDRQMAESVKVGLPLLDAGDNFTKYGPRHGIDFAAARRIIDGQPPGKAGLSPQVIDRNNFPVAAGDNFHRQEIYRNVPGGTEMINELATRHAGDPAARGQAAITRDIKKDLWLTAQNSGVPMNQALGKELDAKASALAQHLAAKDPVHSQHGIGIFSNNIARDVARSGEQHARKMASAAAIHGFIGDNARRFVPDSGMVPITRTLKALGLKTRMADVAAGVPIQGAMVEAYRKLARQGAGPVEPFLMGKFGAFRKRVDQFGLPQALHDELVQSHGKWSMPEVSKEPIGVFDGLTSLFKNLAYPIWPASHVRNAASALLNNLIEGTGVRPHIDQFRLMRGTITADELRRSIPNLPAGISDEAARDFARREQFATGKIFDGHSGQFDLDNGIAARMQGGAGGKVTPDLYGADRTGTGGFLHDAGALIGKGVRDQAIQSAAWARHPRTEPSPIAAAGVFGGLADNPALATGRAVGSNIEDFFRGAHWLGARRAGADAAAAGHATRDLHFDYDALTNFEKKWMRKIVPFYTFARKNLPLQVDRAIHNPFAVVAQMRAMSAGRDGETYLPDYLAGGAAIPTGPEVDGKRQFISGLGTPLEEALERFKFKGGLPDIPATALAFGANMNPLIKAPIEQVFNTQFHTGRKLTDLRAPATASAIGHLFGEDNPQALAQFLVNTPATRFITTLDRLIDDRKGFLAKAANLGTGIKVTDVDLEKARVAEAAQARNELLSRMPHVKGYTNYYVKPGEEANLQPEETEMLRMLATMQRNARDNAARMRIGVTPPR